MITIIGKYTESGLEKIFLLKYNLGKRDRKNIRGELRNVAVATNDKN